MKQTTRMRILVAVMAPLLAFAPVGCKSNKDASLGGDVKSKAPLAERLQDAKTAVKDGKATIKAAENEINRVSGIPKSKQGPLVRYGELCSNDKLKLQQRIDALEGENRELKESIKVAKGLTDASSILSGGVTSAISQQSKTLAECREENDALKQELDKLKTAQPPVIPEVKTFPGKASSISG